VVKVPVKIVGSRTLSEYEIGLINRVKAAERVLLELQAQVVATLDQDRERKKQAAVRVFRRHDNNAENAELQRFEKAEPHWWAAKAKRDIQIGAMELIRAIEQPAG